MKLNKRNVSLISFTDSDVAQHVAVSVNKLVTELTTAGAMFANLPHKFTAPFGLLGDDAKLAFPTGSEGILKLAAVRVRSVVQFGSPC